MRGNIKVFEPFKKRKKKKKHPTKDTSQLRSLTPSKYRYPVYSEFRLTRI